MKTIKAKQTIAGLYGILNVDQTAEVQDKIADQLEAVGLVEIVGKASEDPEEEKNESSISISDNSKKEKREVLVKDEKKSDAGPNAEKGKAK